MEWGGGRGDRERSDELIDGFVLGICKHVE